MSSGLKGNVRETYAPMAARMKVREEKKTIAFGIEPLMPSVTLLFMTSIIVET